MPGTMSLACCSGELMRVVCCLAGCFVPRRSCGAVNCWRMSRPVHINLIKTILFGKYIDTSG